MFVCKIPFALLARARTRPKGAAARPSARATIGYIVYKVYVRSVKKSVQLHENVVQNYIVIR